MKLKLGTKIVLSIASIVLLCMAGLLLITTTNVNKEQTVLTEKLLSAIAAESVLIISDDINSAYMSLAATQSRLQELMNSGGSAQNQERLEVQIKTIMDGNTSGVYAYIYINESSYTGGNIINPRNRLENGEFMLLASDTKPQEIGGVEMLQADMNVVNFGSVQKALQTGEPSIGNPTWQEVAKQGKRFGFGINMPLKNKQGEVKGVVGIFVDLATISDNILDPELSAFKGDYRAVLSANETIAVHQAKEVLGKPFSEVNTHPSAENLHKAVSQRQDGTYDYVNFRGDVMMAQLKSFEIGKTGVHWFALVLAPKDSVYESLYNLQTLIVIAICVSLIIVSLFTVFYIRFNVVRRIHAISEHLFAFFACLRHESDKCPAPLKPKAPDELGAMAVAINHGIEDIQRNLDQDSKLVDEVVTIVEESKQGRFGKTTTLASANPQTNRLKDSLNEMSKALYELVGDNLAEAAQVFKAY
uniref:hypothetical protein n=1 Tax=uncultured Helicobacter sp. TaxID=175537 RepID=UPI00374EEE50